MTTGDAQRATENIDDAPQLDPDQQEAEATASAPEAQSTTASPAPPTEESPDTPPASVPRSPTAQPEQVAAGAAARWAKAATVATAADTLLAAFAAVGALYFSNSALSASTDQLDLSRQTAQSELFKSASEQLDSGKESVRLSGVYLLERLAQDSVTDQPTVRRLLEAFVLTETATGPCKRPERAAPVDIQAALDVIAKYAALPDPTPDVNLGGACLASTYLLGKGLPSAYLGEADLTDADLSGADLSGADLTAVIYDESTRWPEGFVPPPSA